VRLRGNGKPAELARLEEQLEQATAEQAQADATLAAAERARDALDGLDAEAWRQAESEVASHRSEAERLAKATATLRGKAADEAERLARADLGRVEAEASKVDRQLGEHEAAIAKLREQREQLDGKLDDARDAVAAARVPYLPPGSEEARRHDQRERQRAEVLHWHARHAEADDRLSRRDRAEVLAVRERLRAEAKAEFEQMVEQARRAGTLVEVRGPDGTVERVA
jgi:hypothetical protein